jgi:hypothetical protein
MFMVLRLTSILKFVFSLKLKKAKIKGKTTGGILQMLGLKNRRLVWRVGVKNIFSLISKKKKI